METDTRFHHRPAPRTAYLLGRPASTWVDAISRTRADRHDTEGDLTDVD